MDTESGAARGYRRRLSRCKLRRSASSRPSRGASCAEEEENEEEEDEVEDGEDEEEEKEEEEEEEEEDEGAPSAECMCAASCSSTGTSLFPAELLAALLVGVGGYTASMRGSASTSEPRRAASDCSDGEEEAEV